MNQLERKYRRYFNCPDSISSEVIWFHILIWVLLLLFLLEGLVRLFEHFCGNTNNTAHQILPIFLS